MLPPRLPVPQDRQSATVATPQPSQTPQATTHITDPLNSHLSPIAIRTFVRSDRNGRVPDVVFPGQGALLIAAIVTGLPLLFRDFHLSGKNALTPGLPFEQLGLGK